MAIYHFHVGIVSRKTGRSSVAASAYRSAEKLHSKRDGITHDYTPVKTDSISAAAYRSGEKLHSEHEGKTHDYTRKRGVVHSEIMLPKNAPNEFKIRAILWNSVEKSEKRYDAQTARDIDVALPIEFDRQEQIKIMREYIQENFVSHGMCTDFAIHDKGDGNPHAHILLTTRDVTEKGFGKKNRDWNNKSYLKSWRENWAKKCNERLREKGLSERIDHRTLKEQGINREPTIHIGVTAKHMRDSDRMREYNEIVAHNARINPEAIAEYMHELKQGYMILDKEFSKLNQESTEAEREIQALRVQAEDIDEHTEYIHSLENQIIELKTKRQEMGLFTSKKAIDEEIIKFEKSYKQAENYLKQKYSITPDEAMTKIEQFKSTIKSKKHFQERLHDKLTPIIEDKKIFTLEYQRQKLLAEINHNGQRIKDKLAQLDKENLLSEKSAQDRITRLQSESKIDNITRENLLEIRKDLQYEQAQAYINFLQECEKAKRHIRTR